MKKPADIQALVSAFETHSGRSVWGAEQGSEPWHFMRLGVITASNAHRAVAKKDSETRASYMAELVAQIATGIAKEFDARALEWGKQNEDAARASYEFSTGHLVTQLPFVFKDTSFREGCSPDGIVNDEKGVEIKCPFATENYIKFLTSDKIKSEWAWQAQFTLRVMDAQQWDFVQYDPRMRKAPMKILSVGRDPEKQNCFEEMIPQFIADMDRMLEKIGIPFGEHWKAAV